MITQIDAEGYSGPWMNYNRQPYHPEAEPQDGRGHMSQGAMSHAYKINHNFSDSHSKYAGNQANAPKNMPYIKTTNEILIILNTPIALIDI